MKLNHEQHHEAMQQSARSLASTLLALADTDAILALLDDLCTPAELESIIDRWRVAQLLDAGHPYREINELTGVSVTTVARVARCLQQGTGGYRMALKCQSKPSNSSQ